MKFYRCDECKKEDRLYEESIIVLKGYMPSNKGGILLPERMQVHHFCSNKCFEKWIGLEKP